VAHGAFLIAFLAIFVRWTGNHLWNILAFGAHQYRSTQSPLDGLYHQQQVLLRNTPGDAETIIDFMNLSYQWKSKVKSPLRRNIAILAIGLLHWLAFSAAGIFSSKVAITGDHALVRSDHCGWMASIFGVDIPTNQTLKDVTNALFITGRQSAREALAYKSACYETDVSGTPSPCDVYVQRRLNSRINRTAPCPFEKSVCETPYAVELDTGYIDSRQHLGINTQDSDRISMRRVTTCSIVSAEDKFASPWTRVSESNTLPSYPVFQNDSYRSYDLGASISGFSYYYGQGVANHTFTISNSTVWNQRSPYQALYVFSFP
jgi:hypothetical protein